jgi:hypothetical protein
MIQAILQTIQDIYEKTQPSYFEQKLLVKLSEKPNMIQGCSTSSALYPFYERLAAKGLVDRHEFKFKPATGKTDSYEFYKLKQHFND